MIRSTFRSSTYSTARRAASYIAVVLGGLLLLSCEKTAEVTPPPAPPPTYSGPEFLRTSVASMATLNGYRPILVSGYGLVVNLDDTGSPDCPPALRAWMLEELAKRGFGRHSTGFDRLTPEQVLASDRTAVVRVDGIIPPGAIEGDRFDLLISAIPNTSTTSLENGTLYTCDLAVGGANLRPSATTPIAHGRGPAFVNPFLKRTGNEPPADHRIGRVLGGGVVASPSELELITNEPSYRLTRQIADRINGRFPQTPDDEYPIAVPRSDTSIALNVIKTFEDEPRRMLDLISHLYLNPTVNFNREKAKELIRNVQQPGQDVYADDMAYTWEAMGKYVVPLISELYTHANPRIRVAALQAGARLDDLDTAEPLAALASGNQAEYSQRATKLLGVLLKRHRTTPKLIEPLRELLDSNDTRVRLAAYDALAEINDASIRRFAFGDKLELAQVRCDKPMVYVARQGRPRVILFNDRIGFNKPLTFSMWDDRLMIRAAEGAKLVDVFHKRPGQRAETQQIPDNVPYLTGVMAFNPEIDSKSPGFDMTYAEIVTVLHKLVTQRHIDAPLVLQTSDLDARIAALRSEEMIREARPESGTEAPRPDHSKPKVQEKDGGLLGIFDTEPESKSSPPPQENPEKKKGFLGF